jgi:hypothetical protein
MEPILITGLPRSGTTFVASVLAHPEHVYNIGEPFLHRVGADHHYPYYRIKTTNGTRYDRLLRQVFRYKELFRYRVKTLESSLKGIRRYVLGSGRTLEYVQAWWITQVLGREGRLLAKEPHALMLTLPLVQNRDCRVLVLVRHPGGQVSSKLSLGWTQPRDRPRSLLDQPKLIEDHLSWLPDMLSETERSPVEDLGLMWRAQYSVLLNYLDEIGGAEHLRVVRHEDVCLNPIDHFSSLYDWAGLPWTQEVEVTIEELTSPRNPTERSENTDPHQHRHRRDSSTVVDVWKRRLTKEQIRKLRTVTEPVASEFYDEETWH